MGLPLDIPLCHYETGDGRQRLSARLDELTLTYCVVEQGPEGRTLELRRYVPSLREARRWATAYREQQLRAMAWRSPTGEAARGPAPKVPTGPRANPCARPPSCRRGGAAQRPWTRSR
jgi:hypothetical protein